MDSRPKRIGTGDPPLVEYRRTRCWNGLECCFSRESISRPTDWTIRDDRHVMIVHLAGKMSVLETELDGRSGSLGPATPGELWTIPSGSRYASYAHGDDIEFAVLYLPKKPPTSKAETGMTPLFGLRDEVMLSSLRRMSQLVEANDDLSRMEAETVADAVANHIRSKYQKADSNDTAPIPPVHLNALQSRMIREYVWDRLSQPISLGDLASLVGLTTHELLASFREVFQTSPAQYVIAQRMRRAQWLLLYSKWDITRIALESGFSSHSHLTSTFTTRIGYPPSYFRSEANKTRVRDRG
ncbi:Regulatory protein PchR [Rubripirellula obstinata]|uniref:Regulatory protein PchR n=1 Tax=Rubripirellula obstinata TaxID=406547 RepID=A0A5B1CF79_9BACT|nr:AraC family transcriptional regulator [Rubripirellula obstinata]KAA1257974.1 Regulatory protein PchR [Rubripirellula obstinata]